MPRASRGLLPSTIAAGLPGLMGEGVIIDHGNGEYSSYAHLIPGSATVRVGQAVEHLDRHRRVGLRLAAGVSLGQILQDLGHVAEGVYSAPTVLARARSLGVDMPITEAVVALLEGRLTARQALRQLMTREARSEY